MELNTRSVCTHTPLASSFLFNESQAVDSEEEPRGRNDKNEEEKDKEKETILKKSSKCNRIYNRL